MGSRRFQCKLLVSLIRKFGYKNFSTERAAAVELDEAVRVGIDSNELKPRKHPGVMKINTCALPNEIVDAVRVISEDHPVKGILNDAKMLANYLFSRHYPWDEEDLQERKQGFTEDAKSRIGELPADASEEQVRHYSGLVRSSVDHLMRRYSYKWSPLDLHDYSCMVYLFTRAAPNYAAVSRVFHEIIKRCPDYQPTSVFDFGSGIGSVLWAAKSCWGSSLKEYINVDSSGSMNDLASLLLQGGKPEADPPPNVFYREFFPAQKVQHSVVVSAHSLMELPSRDARLHTLLSLWDKTQDFLVIVEQGTKPGFRVVLEARDLILSLSNQKGTAHIFAPCPHDAPCPRFMRGPYPCHINVNYFDLPVGKRQYIKKELLSYVIIKKGVRPEGSEWPRIVRPILARHNHVICRLCTEHGNLQEVIFTKDRHGTAMYKCAKKSNWGDRLPVTLAPPPPDQPDEQCPSGATATSDDGSKPD